MLTALVLSVGLVTGVVVATMLRRRRRRRTASRLVVPVDEQHRAMLRKIAAADYAKQLERQRRQ
jgi:hypothetical protein